MWCEIASYQENMGDMGWNKRREKVPQLFLCLWPSEWIQWEGSTLSLSTAQNCEQGPGEVKHPLNAHLDELQWLFWTSNLHYFIHCKWSNVLHFESAFQSELYKYSLSPETLLWNRWINYMVKVIIRNLVVLLNGVQFSCNPGLKCSKSLTPIFTFLYEYSFGLS